MTVIAKIRRMGMVADARMRKALQAAGDNAPCARPLQLLKVTTKAPTKKSGLGFVR